MFPFTNTSTESKKTMRESVFSWNCCGFSKSMLKREIAFDLYLSPVDWWVDCSSSTHEKITILEAGFQYDDPTMTSQQRGYGEVLMM